MMQEGWQGWAIVECSVVKVIEILKYVNSEKQGNSYMATYKPEVHTIIRTRDFTEIQEGLKKYGRVIVSGPPGIGKTTLLMSNINDFSRGYRTCSFVRGYDLEEQNNLEIIRKELSTVKKSLLILDGYDEILRNSIREDLLRIFKEGRKYGIDILMSTRARADIKEFEKNGWLYKMRGFTTEETRELFKRMTANIAMSEQERKAISNIIKKFENNPFAVQEMSDLLASDINVKTDIIKPFEEGISYENNRIKEVSGQVKILTPVQKEIITDVKIIGKSLVDLIKKKPQGVHELTDRQFEELAAEMYEREGYNVVLTQQTRDGGKDLIISEKNNLGDLLIYGQCKKNRPDRPVDINVVKNLHSTVIIDKATAGVVITSSYFSPDADKLAEQIKHQMNLIDFVRLNKIIEKLK